jgi:hypothetical protein
MLPDISEFSYGYAITDELIHWHGTGLTAAPVFPSSFQEGQKGGGWDVKLDRPGIPLFLQFKLSHFMTRRSAQECQNGLFQPPFYRMPVRPLKHSNQHQMLLDLESSGNEVYYSAPAFYKPEELNDAYLTHNVKNRSIWVRPSWIGALPDMDDHHIAFQFNGSKYFCSKARIIEDKADFKSFTNRISSTLDKFGEKGTSAFNLSKLADTVTEISSRWHRIANEKFWVYQTELKSKSPIEQIAYFTSMFLGAQLFIVNRLN